VRLEQKAKAVAVVKPEIVKIVVDMMPGNWWWSRQLFWVGYTMWLFDGRCVSRSCLDNGNKIKKEEFSLVTPHCFSR
jgi:hypothetical protein